MSVSLVNEVNVYYTGSNHAAGNTAKVKSSITPFQKILKSEEEKRAETPVKAEQAEKTVSTKDEGEGGTTALESIFRRAAEKYDISYDFLTAVAKAESDFNTKCVSSAGAKGIMQLMPDECKEFGVTDPFDAEQNIMASAKLLKAHLKKFNGDYILAAAAYNAGSGAVKKYGGVPPYKETQNYVKKIEQYMKDGVTVPDKKVKVSSSEGEGGATKQEIETATSKESETDTTKKDFEVNATQKDLDGITISVGTGDKAVTMTYGAYLKYLELGTLGVG